METAHQYSDAEAALSQVSQDNLKGGGIVVTRHIYRTLFDRTLSEYKRHKFERSSCYI